MFTCPLHYFHYTNKTLRYLLVHTGFHVSRILTTCGHAGLRESISGIANSHACLKPLVINRVIQGLLRCLDRLAPWGHVVAVGEKTRGSDGR
jgi:hypothetical protein